MFWYFLLGAITYRFVVEDVIPMIVRGYRYVRFEIKHYGDTELDRIKYVDDPVRYFIEKEREQKDEETKKRRLEAKIGF